ncbi:hypothetical protein ABZV77_14425 [Streptomyces sp. NPDC004732]
MQARRVTEGRERGHAPSGADTATESYRLGHMKVVAERVEVS